MKKYFYNFDKIGGGRKIRDPDMEKKLLKWFFTYHNVNKRNEKSI